MADEGQKPGMEDMPHFMQRQYGKGASSLEASHEELSEARKELVRFALDLPIRDVRTYSGYKGDLLVEFTTGYDDVLESIKKYAESLGMETVIKERPETCIHEIFCIMPDEDVYALKR